MFYSDNLSLIPYICSLITIISIILQFESKAPNEWYEMSRTNYYPINYQRSTYLIKVAVINSQQYRIASKPIAYRRPPRTALKTVIKFCIT